MLISFEIWVQSLCIGIRFVLPIVLSSKPNIVPGRGGYCFHLRGVLLSRPLKGRQITFTAIFRCVPTTVGNDCSYTNPLLALYLKILQLLSCHELHVSLFIFLLTEYSHQLFEVHYLQGMTLLQLKLLQLKTLTVSKKWSFTNWMKLNSPTKVRIETFKYTFFYKKTVILPESQFS